MSDAAEAAYYEYKMTSVSRRWVLVLTLVGLAASLSSTYVHYRLVVDPSYTSFCDINTSVSCTDVYQSRFGSIAGVPVALAGSLWFVLVLLLTTLGGRGSAVGRENVPAYLFALSTLGLAAVLYLAYASFFILNAACVLCITVYVAVGGIFLISGGATSFPMTKLPTRALQDLRALAGSPYALLTSILFLAGAASAVAFFPRDLAVRAAAAEPAGQASAGAQSEFARWWQSQPRMRVPVAEEGAKVVVVKFNDYQCPPCKQTFLSYQGIFAKYESSHPGAVRFVTKDYPLDPECNANAPNGPHRAGCEAAVAVRLARERDRADQMERWLFDNQDVLTPARIEEGVRQIAGVEDFAARYAEVLEEVRADIALGGLLQVQATPTFFVNGVKVRGGLEPQWFDAALAYELQNSSQ